MKHYINKAAVLGSGVMGSGIACQLANVGIEVTLLDIVPFDLTEDQKANPSYRNSLVNNALAKAVKTKPAPLYSQDFASRIRTGNFDDDFNLISDADWIIEVVVERLDIKKTIFEKVEKFRKPGSFVTSNTSSIPIHLLVDGRSDEFKSNFCGTHFFNPPRYMELLEVIPHTTSSQDILDFFMEFGDKKLGKRTVLCKDTPAFIANRIGVMSITKTFQLTDKYGFKIEEVDALTGPLIARPKTASFQLQDLVGLDTGDKVSQFVYSSVKDDPFFEKIKGQKNPPWLQHLLDNKWLGRKTNQGFYKLERGPKGEKNFKAFNLKTFKYEDSIKPQLTSVGDTRKIELLDKRLQALVDHDSDGGRFLREYFGEFLAYCSNRVPEIADHIYSVDDALRTGYAWEYGPFEYWDFIGINKGIEIAKELGLEVSDWVKTLVAKGHTSFYKIENGKRKYYNIESQSYLTIPGLDSYIILDTFREKPAVFKNSECTIHDIGEDVLCLEFQSKANAIGEGIGQGLAAAIDLAEEGKYKGLIIGNNAKNFTVGANLMNVGMLAMQKQFETLEAMVDGFQQLVMRCRYSNVPVVAATQGYVFGGGCELTMHCDATAIAAESYVGLVEVGVGLIPGGGGTKEMALRASDKYFEGDVHMPTLIDHFKPVATATVATSGHEAYNLNLLKPSKDHIVANTKRNIYEAKKLVLELYDGYQQPIKRNDVLVLGRGGLATLYTAINEFKLGNYMSDYDVEIARKVAWVMCGGDLTSAQNVSEQYLLDLEREAFLSLLGNQKTLDRIQYTLMNNKPLRN